MPLFENSRNFEVHGGTFIDASGGRSGIDRLYDSTIAEAAHDSYYVTNSKPSCLEGTRTQYIEDITSWIAGINQVQQHRLLWMYGPAGVGKSAVAKSCAEKIARQGMLGASFFFSRDNGVDDPARFFTTVAYQLTTKVPQYKKIIGAKVEADYTLPKKGLEVQFNELIITPFLEIARQNTGARWAVFVDGLDECNSDTAQCKIVELVANSIVTHGNKVPLLWAFFSRPEHHIDDAFSPFLKSPFPWKVELPVSRDYDADIRLYFRNALHLPTTLTAMWPSEENLDILVEIVAGLFVYAATVVRFIMDPSALSPPRRLDEVLTFYSQPDTQSGLTVGLDAFYSMIMGRIHPGLLPIVQQILLIHSDLPYEVPIHVLANITGLTIQELEHSLSDLHSVLRLSPEKEEYVPRGNLLFPGSEQIRFYHASFMDFLRNPVRSKEYCIEDQCHYTALAIRAMYLFKELYMMNGIRHDERIWKLRKLLPVFPDEGFTYSECLMFQDMLFYEYLNRQTVRWCVLSGLPHEVIKAIQEVNLEESDHLVGDEMETMPEIQPLFGLRKKQWQLEGPYSPYNLPNSLDMNAPALIKEIYASTASSVFDGIVLCPRLNKVLLRACKDSESSVHTSSQIGLYFSSRIHAAMERAKKFNLEALDDFEVLDYYRNEWFQYQGYEGENIMLLIKSCGLSCITQAAISPWQEFFALIEGGDHRLTKAACRILNQKRDGDLRPQFLSNGFFSFYALVDSLDAMSVGGGLASHTELFQATEVYYKTAQGFLPGDTLLTNLRYVAGHIIREERIFGGLNCRLLDQTMQVCAEVLMEDHWEELFRKLEELLDANEDPDGYLRYIWVIIRCIPSAFSRFESILKAHVKDGVLNTIAEIEGNGMSLAEQLGTYVPVLLDTKQQRTKKLKWVSGPSELWFWVYLESELHPIIDQAFDEALHDRPAWRDAVNEFLAEQEGEVFRKLFYMDDSKLSLSSAPHSDEQTTLISDLKPSPQPLHSQSSDNVTTRVYITTPDANRDEVEGNDATSTLQTSHSAIELGTSSRPTPLGENRRSGKRDKLVQLFRRAFKRS